jgi:FkbM family methyltransferase
MKIFDKIIFKIYLKRIFNHNTLDNIFRFFISFLFIIMNHKIITKNFKMCYFIFLIISNFGRNKIKNVYALNIAASNYNGESGIFIPKLKGKIATDQSKLDNNISKIKIRVVKLDDLLLKIGKIPDVIKIDVEGSEMQVLEGLQETLRKGVKCLMVEVHSEENKAKAISFLKSLGYKVTQVSKFLICKH